MYDEPVRRFVKRQSGPDQKSVRLDRPFSRAIQCRFAKLACYRLLGINAFWVADIPGCLVRGSLRVARLLRYENWREEFQQT